MTATFQILPHPYSKVERRKDGSLAFAKLQVAELGMIDVRGGDVVELVDGEAITLTDECATRKRAAMAAAAERMAQSAAEEETRKAEAAQAARDRLLAGIAALGGGEDVKAVAARVVAETADDVVTTWREKDYERAFRAAGVGFDRAGHRLVAL